MKNIRNIIAIACVSLLAVSCKKFGDTNVSPNGVSTPSTGALLTNVETGLGGFSSQPRGGIYAQQLTETQYTEVSLYAIPVLDFDGIYAASLMDLQSIININAGAQGAVAQTNALNYGSAANQTAVARILKAYIFWTITDRWGDVPYSQALQGAVTGLNPAYDSQKSIYGNLIKELTEAADQIDPSGIAPTGDILYYQADGKDWVAASKQWKKLANSLRMLIALRASKVTEVWAPDATGAITETSAQAFADAYNDADGYISSNADNLVVNYPGNVAGFSNPWWNLYNGRSDYAETTLMTGYAATLGDPRQSQWGSSTVGFPYGLLRIDATDFGNANTNYARVENGTNTLKTEPAVVIGAADVLLAIAEAAERGWITADIAANYQAGIQASWDQWGVTGDISVYMTKPLVALTGTQATDLVNIELQEYLAWYPDGIQAWSNWRRTNVPALTPTPNATNTFCGKTIPRRYVYGANEQATNPVNLAAAIAALGGQNSECARVWWDKP
jgi:hypothetical protein